MISYSAFLRFVQVNAGDSARNLGKLQFIFADLAGRFFPAHRFDANAANVKAGQATGFIIISPRGENQLAYHKNAICSHSFRLYGGNAIL